MSAPPAAPPWYADGLRFTCTQCGNCCDGAPGHVWVSPDEAECIAAHLGLTRELFHARHTRRIGLRHSLLERKNGDCEFLARTADGKTLCSIHAVRPVQCRTWPFWESNLESRATWDATGRDCAGINQGQHHPLPMIQAALAANDALPL